MIIKKEGKTVAKGPNLGRKTSTSGPTVESDDSPSPDETVVYRTGDLVFYVRILTVSAFSVTVCYSLDF